MGKLLLNLRHVPDDEADDVRDMLEGEGIEFYETPPNRWGITVGGIWVRDPDDMPRARALMSEYQAQRLEQARADREARREAGELEGFWASLANNPLQYLVAAAATVMILFILFYPFLGMLGRA